MSDTVDAKTPVRDVMQTSPMVDDLESTASSDISESLRDLILGKTQRPRRPKPQPKKTSSRDLTASYEVIQKKSQSQNGISSFVVVQRDNNTERKDFDTKSGGDNKSISNHSYHTPERGASMKTIDDTRKRYATIETQTVAIQTISTGTDSDLDCRCTWGDEYECSCQECHCRDFAPRRAAKKPIVSDEPEVFTFDNYTESSDHVMQEKKRRDRFRCTCNNCNGGYDSYDSATEPPSDTDDSYTTDFLDLPYQNNEEYHKVLKQLEKKLIARNKERVRRTMMEFEKRSRLNQNLEKPISDYSDDGASMLRKLAAKAAGKKSGCCKCCRCGRKKVNSDIMQNEKRWEEMVPPTVETPGEEQEQEHQQQQDASEETIPAPGYHRIERSLHKSHWKLDPRSGEWVKVCCFQQTDFSRPPPHGDHFKDDYKATNGNGHRKECSCRKKRGLL